MTAGSDHAARVIEAAAIRGMRVAVAESLTGGLLAAALVSVPGASRVFSGGIVAYDTALKRSLLGVDGGLLSRCGPVDEEVARQMAAGVRRACALPGPGGDPSVPRAADLGLATTGVAGPDPDPQTGQEAGTVWIAVSGSGGTLTRALTGLAGKNRGEIRAAAVVAVLELAWEFLEESGGSPAL